MHKKLIALAVAGLASSAGFAQSNVTIYGVVDYGYSYRFDAKNILGRGATPNSASQLNSGQQSASRIGFKGSEDLGNGMKAVFVLEQGFQLDTGAQNTTNLQFNRQAYAGLSGNFGTVTGGRQYSLHYNFINSIDPFGAGGMGRYQNVFAPGSVATNGASAVVGASLALMDPQRVDNSVVYISPSFGGFSVTGAFSNNFSGQEASASNAANNTYYAILGQYLNGPVNAGINYHYIAGGSTAIGSAPVVGSIYLDNVQNVDIGGSYDFKAVKVTALYSYNDLKYNNNNVGNVTLNNYMLGVKLPFGSWTGKASYMYSDGNSKAGDAQQFAVGADYNFSKRTNLYGIYSFINNDGNRLNGVTDSSNSAAYSAGNGYAVGGVYQQGFQVGVRHSF